MTRLPLLLAVALLPGCPSDDGAGGGTETEGGTGTGTGTDSGAATGDDTTGGGDSADGGTGTTSSGSTEDTGSSDSTTGTGTSGGVGCGNGVVDPDEECDDGNEDNDDACLDTCVEATCGDGFVHMGEEDCDDGEDNDDLAGPCRTDCSMCDCQGTNPPPSATCADAGMTCGILGCDGCNFDTTDCQDLNVPSYQGEPGPAFSNEDCWFPCEGYLDTAAADELPTTWGATCDDPAFNKLRLVCGINDSVYRYIDVDKNVFTYLLAANPELGLISDSRDHMGNAFTVAEDAIYVEGVPFHPHNGASWFGGNADCNENSANLTVKNSMCSWEVADCFGQNIAGQRYLWVYVSP